nr:hypothetical protein [uncultured Celeribacter sp.]
MKHTTQGSIDLFAIEKEAHDLRGQMTRDAMISFGKWLRSHFSHHSGGKLA